MGNFNRGGKSGRGGFGDGRGDRPRMHPATCDECNRSCEVPFRPTGDKPVLCSDCFGKKSGNRPQRSSGGRDFGRSDKQMHRAVCDNCGDNCEVPFRPTAGKPIYCSKCFDQMGGSDKNKGGGKSDNKVSEQLEVLNKKLDKILEALTPKIKAETKTEEKDKTKKVAAKKTPIKKTAAETKEKDKTKKVAVKKKTTTKKVAAKKK